MSIYVDYFTGENGNYKTSNRVFKSYKSLYNNINTFKNIKSIVIYDDLKNTPEKVVNGHYSVIDFLKRNIK